MPHFERSIEIAGSAAEIYQLISKMESFPKFMDNVVEVEIVQKKENSTITAWSAEIDGRSLEWKEKDIFRPDQNAIYFELIEGDLDKLVGQWQCHNQGELTELKLIIDFEYGVPMLSAIVTPVLEKKLISNSEEMLAAIKAKVEHS
ncbi:MAG: type II toxin-antitoxin system RatA family toxin [Bacillota bacterium]